MIQKFDLMDLEKFMDKLNSHLAPKEGEIVMESFVEKTPRRKPFLYGLNDRIAELSGKSLLTQYEQGVFGEKESKAGYILIEAGNLDGLSNYSGVYETLRLRIKPRLELKDGRVLPPCSIKLLVEREEWEKEYKERRDHVKKYGLFWKKSDLSGLIPTEWFLRR